MNMNDEHDDDNEEEEEEEEDEERLELALNSNFASELFDCWNEEEEEEEGNNRHVYNPNPNGVVMDDDGNCNNDNIEDDEGCVVVVGDCDEGTLMHRHGSELWLGQFSRLPSFNNDDPSSLLFSSFHNHSSNCSSSSSTLKENDTDDTVRSITTTQPNETNQPASLALLAAQEEEKEKASQHRSTTTTAPENISAARATGSFASSVVQQPSIPIMPLPMSSSSSSYSSIMGIGMNPPTTTMITPLFTGATTQLHPLAIQSSANCPPNGKNVSLSEAATTNTTTNTTPAFFPSLSTFNAITSAAAASASASSTSGNTLNSNNHNNTNHSNNAALMLNAANLQAHAAAVANMAAFFPLPIPSNNSNNNNNMSSGSSSHGSVSTTSVANDSTSKPNHHLDLRANFERSLLHTTTHGIIQPLPSAASSSALYHLNPNLLLPGAQSFNNNNNNSLHPNPPPRPHPHLLPFGFPVNGFHPQAIALGNNNNCMMLNNNMHATSRQPQPQQQQQQQHRHHQHKQQQQAQQQGAMILGEKRLKNAKEQRRAQKIAELIDELRQKMQKSGWSVGVSKSKFNTLSSCADYVKHLVKITNEKEEAVQTIRDDIQNAKRRVAQQQQQQDDEDMAAHTDPSEPESESTTSSLTCSSRSGNDDEASSSLPSSTGDSSFKSSRHHHHHRRKRRSSEDEGACASETESEEGKVVSKKSKLGTHESNSAIFPDEYKSKECASGDTVPCTVTSTSVVSDHTSGCDQDSMEQDPKSPTIKKRRSKHHPSLPSFNGFDLDYREAFVKSNVPQLIASTAGRIIAYNDFFLAITGMSASDVERATIFNFVQPNKLSSVFEIVAKSLRSSDPCVVQQSADSASNNNNERNDDPESNANQRFTNKSPQQWNYAATTLPCIRFSTDPLKQLYITLTLMTDVNPRRRCFHCVLTDSPCTNGDIGCITPDLLELLFTSKTKTPI